MRVILITITAAIVSLAGNTGAQGQTVPTCPEPGSRVGRRSIFLSRSGSMIAFQATRQLVFGSLLVTVALVSSGFGRSEIYQAESQLRHETGRAYMDWSGPFAGPSGWMADPMLHRAGFLTYGPYTRTLPSTKNLVATWHIAYQGGSRRRDAFVLEVHDATAGRTIIRQGFPGGSSSEAAGHAFGYTYLRLGSFRVPKGHAIELRTYWFGEATLKVDYIDVTWRGG